MRINQEEMPLEKYEYESNILLGCDWAIGLGAIDLLIFSKTAEKQEKRRQYFEDFCNMNILNWKL